MKAKILDYILIFILAFLILSFFQDKPEQKQIIQKTGVIINTDTSSLTVPASVKLNIINNNKKTLKLNTCKDIEVSYNSQLKKIEDKSFCKDIEIPAWKTEIINYDKLYNVFINEWNYAFKVNIWESEPLFTNFNVDIRWAFGKFFTFFLYAPIYNLIVFLLEITWNSLFRAIVIITILVRIVLIWPQHQTLKSQKKMQAIQPKIKQIQEKHKWNHQLLGQEMMKLYKEEKVNPMWSCGLMLIQMPILLVLYNIIMYIRDDSNIFYLYDFLKPFDVSQINSVFHSIDLYNSWGKVGIALWITVAILQFLQVKYSMSFNKTEEKDCNKPVKKDDNSMASMMPDQKVMQNFMLYALPIMVWFFTYNFPAWLWVYWGISTLFMLIQQLIVNRIWKKSS